MAAEAVEAHHALEGQVELLTRALKHKSPKPQPRQPKRQPGASAQPVNGGRSKSSKPVPGRKKSTDERIREAKIRREALDQQVEAARANKQPAKQQMPRRARRPSQPELARRKRVEQVEQPAECLEEDRPPVVPVVIACG